MPLAAPAQELTNIPTIPFTPNPAQFDTLTQRNHHLAAPAVADPGEGLSTTAIPIPQAGIIAGIWIHFTATLTITLNGGTAVTKNNWPHGLLKLADFNANFQNQIIHAQGVDLHVHRFISNPALQATSFDTFPGTVGGGDSLTGGAKTIDLTFYLPVAADKSTLVGAIYAQSAQNLITLQLVREAMTNLITLAGGATAVLSGGVFQVATDFFDIPRDPASGAVVTPDLRQVHGVNFFDTPLLSTGAIKVPLIPQGGNLLRLLLRLTSPTGDFSPLSSAASGFTGIDLHYGGNKNPQQWENWSLVARNSEHYGGRLPYNFVALDFMRENPVRDAVSMMGITDFAALINIAAGTAIPANSVVHMVQETLYA